MKKLNVMIMAQLAVLIMFGPVACKTTLQPGGPYNDPVLYNADKTITSSYRILHSFVKWEYDNRAVLPVEVSRAADAVRDNAEKWITSAINLREAYALAPNKESKNNLEKTLDVLQSVLQEAAKYMADNQTRTNPNQ